MLQTLQLTKEEKVRLMSGLFLDCVMRLSAYSLEELRKGPRNELSSEK